MVDVEVKSKRLWIYGGDTRSTADGIGSDVGDERIGGFQDAIGKLGRMLCVL